MEGFRIIAKLTKRFKKREAIRQKSPVFRVTDDLLESCNGTKVAKSLQLTEIEALDS